MGHGPGRWRGRPARARWAAVNGRRRDQGRAGPWRFSTLAPDRVNDGEALVLSLEAEEDSRRWTNIGGTPASGRIRVEATRSGGGELLRGSHEGGGNHGSSCLEGGAR